MRSKLFSARPETVKTGSGRWVRLVPETGGAYRIYDLLNEVYLGRILFDIQDNWIYDGQALHVEEQEELATVLTGNQKEMDKLLKSIGI
jgi:hypothetical protein